MWSCVCLVKCEIMRLMAQGTGTLEPQKFWNEREGKPRRRERNWKQNQDKLQDGQGNIN